ncbi:EID1-like F-box protein 3 [Ancistrocladus abbreviatus]
MSNGGNSSQRLKGSNSESGLFNERILVLVFEAMKWDLHALCAAAAVNRKLQAVAKRVLWRELCLNRAPRLVAALLSGGSNGGKISGGWEGLAKLLCYCCGCSQLTNLHFRAEKSQPGHFVKASRFSKTSGRSFLVKKCRGDLLYVSDPCEHNSVKDGEEYDLGVYRGVFRGFKNSRTWACLMRRQAKLEEHVKCPYCGARVWSMTSARLVPRSAARRLGTQDGGLEYFVCVNGHLHGMCWLVPLSSGTEDDDDDVEDDDDEDDENHYFEREAESSSHGEHEGTSSSNGEEVVAGEEWAEGKQLDELISGF